VQALIKREIKTVKVDVTWNSKKVHIKNDTNRGIMRQSIDSQLKKLLTEMLDKVTAQKVMVITYDVSVPLVKQTSF
jgi:DNA polymerase I